MVHYYQVSIHIPYQNKKFFILWDCQIHDGMLGAKSLKRLCDKNVFKATVHTSLCT